MCGRYTLFTDFESLIDRFDIEYSMEEDLFMPSYNIAPSHQVVSIINDGNKNRLGKLRWGLIPGWAKDEKVSYKMINARSETVDQKPSYRNAFIKRRCLIPMDSFYEWKKHDSGKIPMRIKMKSDEVFAVAGLWESWNAPDGRTIHSCTILTTEANSLVSDIHDRMPVILRPEDEKVWLNTKIQEKETLKRLLVPYDASFMEAYAVSSDVNSPKNNHIGLLNSL